MNIALLLVVKCKSDIIINRTQCNYITWLLCIYIVACSNLVLYYQFIHDISSINELTNRRSKTSFECVNVKC